MTTRPCEAFEQRGRCSAPDPQHGRARRGHSARLMRSWQKARR